MRERYVSTRVGCGVCARARAHVRASAARLVELASDAAHAVELLLEIGQRPDVDRRAIEHDGSDRLLPDHSDVLLRRVDHG